ncbi:MAG: YitT family protein [Spirochaetales bacterium]|nr:YitT family protein [Spirochaetales bacterium]
MQKKFYQQVYNVLSIIVGTFIAACGIALFSNPGKITGGGVTGVGTILYYTIGWDPGLVMLILNIPLYLLGFKVFGSKYGVKVLLGSILLSVWVSVLGQLTGYQGVLDYSHELSRLLSGIAYGVLVGTGIGIVMRTGSNTGGTDIIAQVIAKYTPFNVGSVEFCLNAVVVCCGGLIFGIESTFFAIIAMFISGRMINFVTTTMGTGLAKTAYIFSMNKSKQISQRVIKDLHHGGTIFLGEGIFTGDERPMLVVVVPNQQIRQLVRIVHEEDDKAFVYVVDAYMVMGNGFAALNKVAKEEH